jgi:gliding motility-associated-like protein
MIKFLGGLKNSIFTHKYRRMHVLLRVGCFLLFGVWPLWCSGQFILNGAATVLNDSCYQLTPEVNFVAGSIWNPDKINLNESFDVVVQVKLGCKDAAGADGIVFGFQPVSTSIGQAGGGIGFQNIVPSLGIEIDNFQNTGLGDPVFDHIAIIRDGDVDHNGPNNLSGPVQADEMRANIEDCNFYDLRVSWNAEEQLLEVYFNCHLRLIYQGDMVNTIFNGDPEVFWGFTSATGGLNNTHEVCFTYTTFLDELEDVVVCPGGTVRLEARGGIAYQWTPTTGLSDPTSPRPYVTPESTTLYRVEIIDECNRPFFDEVLVEVAGDSVFFDLGPDTLLCEGDVLTLDVSSGQAEYEWSTGATSPFIDASQPGEFAVTVTRTDTFCMAEDLVFLTYTDLPEVVLGADTTLCEEQELALTINNPALNNQWQDGSTQDSFVVREPGIYTLTGSNICGSDTEIIQVNYESCRDVYIPSAFSPNGDGFNDRFFPEHGGDVLQVNLMQVFDRWGNLVFENKNFAAGQIEQGWNGRFREKELPTGLYVYRIELTFRDGVTADRKGGIYLLR